MSASQTSTFKNLAVLWHTFRGYRWQVIILIVLGIVGADTYLKKEHKCG